MDYVVSIIPILLYLLAIKGMDALSFSTWKRLCICFAWGVISCVAAFAITHYVHIGNVWEHSWTAPLLEETLKALLIIRLVILPPSTGGTGRISFFAEAMVYGMAVGAGFSLLENILYITYNSEEITLLHCIIRGCGTALIHMGCTAFLAVILVIYARKIRNVQNGTSKGPSQMPATSFGLPRFTPLMAQIEHTIYALCCAFLVAAVIHTLYNKFLLPPFIQLLVTIVLFLVLFMWLYQVEERLINRWLDTCVSDDITLLGAIKEGNLDTTRAGQYLIQVKERFHPEVFFDMLVYLQLYLELSIKAKSHLILRGADMEIPIPESEHKEDLERIKELKTLHSNIGIAGLSVLAPLIHLKDADKWVINELL